MIWQRLVTREGESVDLLVGARCQVPTYSIPRLTLDFSLCTVAREKNSMPCYT
jgi:hypothetical protein